MEEDCRRVSFHGSTAGRSSSKTVTSSAKKDNGQMISAMKQTVRLKMAAASDDSEGKLGDLYVIGAELGKGGFGVVFSATRTIDNKLVVLKCIEMKKIFQYQQQADGTLLPMEVAMLNKVRDVPGVLKLLDVFHGPDLYVLVMEQVPPPYIDLHYYAISYYITDREASDIMRQLIDIIRGVHAAGVFHADIKCGNVLFEGKTKRIHLIDFGSARLMHDGVFDKRGGTRSCYSPEMITKGLFHAESSTVWALGLIAYKMIARHSPFKTKEEITERATVKLPRNFSYGLKNFVRRCLAHDPLQRPTLKELSRHVWVVGPVRCCWLSLKEYRRNRSAVRRGMEDPSLLPAVVQDGTSASAAAEADKVDTETTELE